MGCFTPGYYNQVKDYLHPHLYDFIHYYGERNIFDLPLYHGCNKKNRNGTRKLIEYNQGHQCIVPTNKLYWRKTKDKYKRNTKRVYWTRYMTWSNLFKNKGNFVYNYKLKMFEHISKRPMHYDHDFLQQIRKDVLK